MDHVIVVFSLSTYSYLLITPHFLLEWSYFIRHFLTAQSCWGLRLAQKDTTEGGVRAIHCLSLNHLSYFNLWLPYRAVQGPNCSYHVWKQVHELTWCVYMCIMLSLEVSVQHMYFLCIIVYIWLLVSYINYFYYMKYYYNQYHNHSQILLCCQNIILVMIII